MSSLEVKQVQIKKEVSNYTELANQLSNLSWHKLTASPWKEEYPYFPEVKFQIAYDEKHIYLHYDVQEEYVKAQFIRPNENIWEDSCVEFFISLDNKETYYNFEFNALGAGLIGYGSSDKSTRNRLTPDEILKVDSFIQVSTINAVKSWQQILRIPLAIIQVNPGTLNGKTLHANFYKCGDGLPNPHFIAWNNINADKPNFHLPAFFGEIKFS